MLNKDTIVITSIYEPFWGTDQFMRSCYRLGIPVINIFNGIAYKGNGDILKRMFDSLGDLKSKGYKYVTYADGADSFFVREFRPPSGKVIFSTEKACYPHPELAAQYPPAKSPWRFLNGGGWCGEIDLMMKFFDSYGLNKFGEVDVSGQHEIMLAYLQAIKEGFPIELDDTCTYFQTTAFAEVGEFEISCNPDPIITNTVTGSIPCVFHGNGRTDMEWIYNLYK